MTCPTCSTVAPTGARFCASCGTDLSQRDERRIVTTVFADIVGFTGLSESLDPERVKNLVDQCFQALGRDVDAFGGRVDKILGDGMLALFGAPTAHEDDAERAVRAALRMHETASAFSNDAGTELQLRIGVNTGEVLVGAIGGEGDYTAMGDVVNTASRLQSMAVPGTVLVGPDTEEATRTAIEYEPLGTSEVRGRQGEVTVFRAIAPLGLPGARSDGDGRLIGRGSELALLTTAIDTALRSDRAHMLLILGDAGVGKSRLARAVAEHGQSEHNVALLSGRCVPYGEANAWFPLAEAVRTSLALPDEATAEQVASVATRSFAATFGLADDDPTVIRTRNGLLHLLGHDVDFSSTDNQSGAEEAGRAIRVGFEAAVRHQPIVLWLTDLHWADHMVLELLDDILNRMSRSPFVIIATARHSLTEQWIPQPSRSNVVTVSLEPLNDSESRELLAELADIELSDEVADDLIHRAGGNPFFLQELSTLVSSSGVEAVDAVPGSVRGLVAARLDGLTDVERAVLEDAAVLGRRGLVSSLRTMGEYTRGSAEPIGEGLQGLVAKDVLTVHNQAWEFRSNVVRDVAYQRLTKSRRAEMHAGVAQYLEQHGSRNVDTIAFHYRSAASLVNDIGPILHVPPDVRDRAVQRTIEAAALARLDKSNVVVVKLLNEALELAADDDALRHQLLLDRARANLDQQDVGSARQDIDTVLGESPNRNDNASAVVLLGEIAQIGGDVASAIQHYEHAYEEFLADGDDHNASSALRQMGLTYMTHGRSDRAEEAFERALVSQVRAEDRIGEAWTRQNLAWLSYSSGETELAERRILAAIEVFEDLGDLAGLSYCEGLLAYVRLHQGRREESRELADRVLVNARESGERWGEAMTLVLIGALELWSGKPDVAVQYGENALRIFRDISEPIGRFQAVAVLSRSLVRSGRPEEGFRLLRDSTQASAIASAPGIQRQVRTIGAAASVTVGDPEGAMRWLGGADPEETDLTTIGGSDQLVAYGLASLQLGEDATAFAALAAAAEPDIEGIRSANAMSALAIAELARGDLEAADTLVAEVAASQRSTYADRQLALVASVGVALRRGDNDAAIEGIEALTTLLEPTTDRLAELLFRLTEARVHAVLGSTAASAVAERARRMADALGVEAAGWIKLLDRLLHAS